MDEQPAYWRQVVSQIFHDFKWGRDLTLSTLIALAGLIIQLIGIPSTRHDRSILFLSVIGPYVVVLGGHILWKLVKAPRELHEKLKTVHVTREQEWLRKEQDLNSAIGKQNVEISSLKWPTDRPQLSFRNWGDRGIRFVEPFQPGSSAFNLGFHLFNDGGAALDVAVEKFKIGTKYSVISETVSRIGSKAEGFIAIWIEDKNALTKWRIDGALQETWEQMFKDKKLTYSEKLSVPVSVVYKDFNGLGYRTKCNLVFTPVMGSRSSRLEFSAPQQERLESKT